MPARSKILAILFPVVCAALTAFAYGQAIHSYFSSDDWLMLWYYGRLPIAQPWRFFSPEVVWFYRPLQSLQFGLLYSVFGLDALPYNLALLACHGLAAAGVYLLARELDTRPWFGEAVTLLFLTQWTYADVLLWKSNVNTLQWAVLTLGSCVCFMRSLHPTARPGWRVAAFTLGGLAFMAKEMAVNGPLLLTLLWAYRELKPADLRPPVLAATVRRAASVLWPSFALAVVYVLFHRLGVRDIAEDKTGYFFVTPAVALEQAGIIYNHLLLSVVVDPLRARALELPLIGRVASALVLPALVFLVGWRLRDRLLLFGTAWILLAFLPVVLLRDFHASRFYYLAAAGAAVVLARGAVLLVGGAAARTPAIRTSGVAGVCAVLLCWSGANIVRARHLVEADIRDAARVRSLFAVLEGARGTVEPGGLVVLQNAPAGYFGNGFGVREFVRLALKDDTLEGVMQGQPLPAERLARLQKATIVYTVDAGAAAPRVQRVR